MDQLYALEVLEDSPIHTISTRVPIVEACVDRVVNVLHDTVTPLLTHNYSTISNLSSVLAASGGVPSSKDDDSVGSSTTGTASTLALLALINKLQDVLNNQDFWKAGQRN